MLIKKILSVLLVVLMALPVSVALAATDTMNDVVVDNRARKVTISGTSIQPDGTPVAVSVWYPLTTAGDVGKDKALMELNAYTNQTTVTGGTYELTFYLKAQDLSGQYTAMVYIPGMETPLLKSFPYSDVAKRETIIADVKNVANGVPEIIATLDTNINAINVAAGVSYGDYSDSQKEYVAQHVVDNRPQEEQLDDAATSLSNTLQDVVTALDAVEKLATGTRAEIKAILDAELTDKKMQINASATEMQAALTAYNALYGTEETKAVIAFEAGAKNLVTPEDVTTLLLFAIEEAQKIEEEPQNSAPGVNNNSSSSGKGNSGSLGVYIGNDELTPDETVEVKEDANDAFSDLQNVLWAKNAINILAERGIVSGKEQGLFCPNDVITREEFVKLLVSALEIFTLTETTLPFDDVRYGSWYYESIAMAHTLGLVAGTGENLFGVGEPIKRQDMAVLLDRFLTYQKTSFEEGEEPSYADEEAIAEYAISSVKKLSKNGIFQGREDDSFDPNATASRAEVAVIIYRIMYKLNLL